MSSSYVKNRARLTSGLSSLSRYLPNLLTVGIVGGVGLIGYSLYKKFIASTPFGDASVAADKAGAVDLTTRNVTTAASLTQLENALKAQGLVVGNLHNGYANDLNAAMDCASVDHDHVTGLVKSMGLETFQLTAIAYGQRELRNYRNSILHIFEPSVWGDLFSEKKLYGGLKFHLQTVLTSSEFASLAAYVNTVP